MEPLAAQHTCAIGIQPRGMRDYELPRSAVDGDVSSRRKKIGSIQAHAGGEI